MGSARNENLTVKVLQHERGVNGVYIKFDENNNNHHSKPTMEISESEFNKNQPVENRTDLGNSTKRKITIDKEVTDKSKKTKWFETGTSQIITGNKRKILQSDPYQQMIESIATLEKHLASLDNQITRFTQATQSSDASLKQASDSSKALMEQAAELEQQIKLNKVGTQHEMQMQMKNLYKLKFQISEVEKLRMTKTQYLAKQKKWLKNLIINRTETLREIELLREQRDLMVQNQHREPSNSTLKTSGPVPTVCANREPEQTRSIKSNLPESTKLTLQPEQEQPISSTISSTSNISLFAHTKTMIKEEHNNDNRLVNVDVAMDKLREQIKTMRHNSRATSNCGYWAEYVLIAINDLLHGKPCPNSQVTTKPSTNETTLTIHTFEMVPIKKEGGGFIESNKVAPLSSLRVASETGLNAHLPPTIEHVYDLEAGVEQTSINLNPHMVPMTQARIDDLNSELMTKAKSIPTGVFYGTLTLISASKTMNNHVISFCATAEKVFYIDPHRYSAKQQKDPVFTDLTEVYKFSHDRQPDHKYIYFDHCYYLGSNLQPENQNRPGVR